MNFLKYRDNQVILDREELLLVKEFNQLLDLERNKCEDDKKGVLGLRVVKELTFMYLNYDWKSPYSEYSEEERKFAALQDSKLTEQELLDPVFLEACKKYQDLQDTRILKMLRASYKAIDTLRIFFETVDLTETDTFTGKPIYNAKDIISNIQNLGKMIEGLQQLENLVKTEREQSKNLRGDAEPGMFDSV